jgi:hypothetical protein
MKSKRKNLFASANRDRNEPDITRILERYHIPFVKQPPLAGFDILVLTSPVQLWEVKNSTYKWTLTKAEQERLDYCKHNGIVYRVIETMEQAVDAIAERMTK